MPTAELAHVRMWYDERGQGDPLVALRRPDLVRRLLFAAGVFHRDGWENGILDGEPPDFLRQSYGEVSPDGAGHYEVIVAKLAAMHAHEPALTHDDLAKITCRTLQTGCPALTRPSGA